MAVGVEQRLELDSGGKLAVVLGSFKVLLLPCCISGARKAGDFVLVVGGSLEICRPVIEVKRFPKLKSGILLILSRIALRVRLHLEGEVFKCSMSQLGFLFGLLSLNDVGVWVGGAGRDGADGPASVHVSG